MKTDLEQTVSDEWLEADGLGGFASGTVSGIRTRRYHSLLLTATNPPAGRVVLVNGFDAAVQTANGAHALSSQLYAGNVMHPDGATRIASFSAEPWPKWIYALADGAELEQEIFVAHGAAVVALTWRSRPTTKASILTVRPFFSGRDYHALHHENGAFQFEPRIEARRLIWRPYQGIPGIIALHNGAYKHKADWYRNFVYRQEQERGLDFMEDLAAPGIFQFDLSAGAAVLLFAAEVNAGTALIREENPEHLIVRLRTAEKKRRVAFLTPLDRAADAYLVKRGLGKTIVAGYPWFTDWGRDTFISLRGLCLATNRLDDAAEILLQWSTVVSEGMLPNRFPDRGDRPEYNSVDASLWYVIAVHEFLAAIGRRGESVALSQKTSLEEAVDAILRGYYRGTRYGHSR